MGRFDPRNGLDTLLEATRILKDQGRDFRVQVVGDGPLRVAACRSSRGSSRRAWMFAMSRTSRSRIEVT